MSKDKNNEENSVDTEKSTSNVNTQQSKGVEKTYSIKSSRAMEKDETDGFYIKLVDDKGKTPSINGKTVEFYVSRKMVMQAFTNEDLDVDSLGSPDNARADIKEIFDASEISATILKKTAGESFIADEHTKTAYDEKGNLVAPVKGQRYNVKEDGYRFDYTAGVQIKIDPKLFKKAVLESMDLQLKEIALKQAKATAGLE